jgi:hypothetical protein
MKKYPCAYKLQYFADVRPTAPELKAAGAQGADALIMFAIDRDQHGVKVFRQSVDGNRSKKTPVPVNGEDMWKLWLFQAGELMEDESLHPNKRKICRDLYDSITETILNAQIGAQHLLRDPDLSEGN